MIRAIDQAREYHLAGQLSEAEAIYRQILAREPACAEALHWLGVLAAQCGQLGQAAALIEQAIHINPTSPDYHNNLGEALRATNRFDEAVSAYQRALALRPDFAVAYDNLGSALQEQRKLDQAIKAFRDALAIDPEYAQAHNNLGIALQIQGDLKGAIAAFQRALALKPDYAEACNNLGVALQDDGKPSDAIPLLRRALDILPESAQVRYNIGNAWHAQGRLEEAIAAYRQALSLDPTHARAHSNMLLCMHYRADIDPQALFAEHRQWDAQQACSLAKAVQPYVNDRTPGRQLRIGYLSPDFRSHSVAHFIAPILATHDPNSFAIICYADVPRPDSVTTYLRSLAGEWRDIADLSDAQVVERIREDKIDILVDLAGHTGQNRLLVFARKPAPVQVTYLGYPNTTGLSTMDYRLTDPVADPPDQTERWHSEKLVRLTNGFLCYQPPEAAPPITALPARSAGHVVFASFNNASKINSRVGAVWAQILRALPQSRLVLKAMRLTDAGTRQRLLDLFEAHGLSRERIEMLGPIAADNEHLRVYQRVDIALDPFPYNGTTTTCEALWMGVPVVTLAGETHAGRVGASLLSTLQLPELIAQDSETYVRIALELARDLKKLETLREGLRERVASSRLTDARTFSRQLEEAYRLMWRTWCEGLKAQREKQDTVRDS
jgi:protein O-GlcNAc transferase